MIDYAEALRLLLLDVQPLDVETIAVSDALGRVLAHAVQSPESLPPFDNSAMDGFALCSGGRACTAGSRFAVVGERAAGDAPVDAGRGAWEIMTGAPLPHGADTVVPVEQVEVVERDPAGRPVDIRLTLDVPPDQHIRRAGSDIEAGDTALRAGMPLREAEAMVLAAIGVDHVQVQRRPRVALLTTGRELVDHAGPLEPGQIRNSNGPFLALRLRAAGAEVVHRETVVDDAGAFRAALDRARAAGADVIVTTGAVSMGRYDFIPATLEALGARTLFHKVRIRPGKPILAAQLGTGERLIALPGNPASTAVGLRFFVEPVLRAMLGMPAEAEIRLPIGSAYRKRVPLRMYLKARVSLDATGRLCAEVLDGQESFRIRPLLEADAWVVVRADVDALEAGDSVRVHARGHLDTLGVQH